MPLPEIFAIAAVGEKLVGHARPMTLVESDFFDMSPNPFLNKFPNIPVERSEWGI